MINLSCIDNYPYGRGENICKCGGRIYFGMYCEFCDCPEGSDKGKEKRDQWLLACILKHGL